MNANTLNKLEFYKIKEILSKFANTDLGKQLIDNIHPSHKKEEVQYMLNQTQEGIQLLYQKSAPCITNISDITVDLKKLEQGSILSTKSLLNLANTFQLAQKLKDYFNEEYIENTNYPILSNLFSNLYTNKNIVDTIFSCIIDEETIDDRASANLYSIRKKQRKLEQDIRSKLTDILHSSTYSKYIQENIITIRNERFVIPIKEEHRSQIKGFVHDISNAGSTVFIEPISVFEANNEINQLKLEEEIEIEKILQNLSLLFLPYTNQLLLDLETIGTLDFIFAKAKYAKSINANIPKLNSNKEIELIDAKHPLLDKNTAVPISLTLGKSYSTLLITGPNTGGKTVTLKTVGLLTCMACSGLAIPANGKSTIYVFDCIFADIGDDQSIGDSLSTFSSHMINIIDITKNANSNSLILVDELGSGTDPIEGANLAISILDTFEQLGALTIATTHYQELKKYALTKSNFENASVEFDINTLSPTYKLLIGIPGKSNAFEISKKLGLSEKIITNAKKNMQAEDIEFEELLKNIYDNKIKIEQEKEEISKNLAEISSLKKALQHNLSDLKLQEQNLIHKAKVKAREILLDAKEEANDIIKKMNSLSNNKDLEHLRNELNTKIKKLHDDNDTPASSYSTHSLSTSLLPEEIHPNLEVFVSTLQKNGVVLSNISKSNEVQVQIGSIKMTLPIQSLEKIPTLPNHKPNKKTSSNINYTKKLNTKNIKSEINVIGLTVEEAIFVVDKFLDDCSLAKLETARIVHGKGTGKLRSGIHQFLKSHSHVKSFRLGMYGEGEMGVTIVEIK